MRDVVNRVKESGSSLAGHYGATAMKVLSSQDITQGQSNLESNQLAQGGDQGIMNNLITQRLEAGSTLKRQADTQITKDVDAYTGATSGLLTELMKNRKLGGEIKDQRDQMSGIVGVANFLT